MQTIMLQQLRIHFGEDFDELYANTQSYVKSLISRYSWWIDSRAMLQSEGPLSRMVEDCLSHIVEQGDKVEGFKSYTSYLSQFYGSTKKDAKAVGEAYPSEETSVIWSTLGGTSDNPPSSSLLEDNTVVEDELHFFSPEQADFIRVYSRLGVDGAMDEFNITRKQAYTRRNSIKQVIANRIEKAAP